MTKVELIGTIRTQFQIINYELSTIQKENSSDPNVKNFYNLNVSKFQKLTGTKKGRTKSDVLGTGNLSRMNKQQLMTIFQNQNIFLASQYASAEGRQEDFEKARASWAKNHPSGGELTADEYRNMVEFFNNSPRIYKELKELHYVESDDIVDLVQSGLTESDIVEAIDYLNEKNVFKTQKGSYKRALSKGEYQLKDLVKDTSYYLHGNPENIKFAEIVKRNRARGDI